jgi:hypothetical protein
MFRYFHYESCRGLEASVLIYEEIDKYYDWCVEKFGETAAKRRVYIALSRVKEYAIFTFKDLNHWLYQSVVGQHSILREGFVWD